MNYYNEIKTDNNDIENGITLLIRGGGIKSASAIGTIQALEDYEIPILAISGTSIGSIPAALYSCGYSAEEILNIFLEYNKRVIRSLNIFGGKGTIEIEKYLNKIIETLNFTQTNIPCYITASNGNLFQANPFIFSGQTTPNTTLAQACSASASFPIIYKPTNLKIEDKKYSFIDGGVTMNPFVPKITDYPKIYSTFISDKERKILKRKKLYNWEKPPYIAEQSADIIIKPDLGSTGTIGTISDIINGYYRGYEATRQMIDDLECERRYSYIRKKTV